MPLVGMSNLWVNDTTYARLDTGLTGVVRSHRRRGIATALKLRTIAYAQQRGARTIEAGNEEHSPMYQLNLRLGFCPRPAWVSYRAQVAPGA
jgi:GNAT superfamily N-acetyltransferase